MSRPPEHQSRLLRFPIALAIALGTLLLSGAFIAGVGQADRTPSATDSLPEGYDSTTVEELSAELPQGEGSLALVLFTADEGTLDQAQIGRLTEVYADLVTRATEAAGPSGSQATGPSEESGPPEGGNPDTGSGQGTGPEQDQSDDGPLRLSNDQSAALGVVPIALEGSSEIAALVEELRQILADESPEGITAELTGPAAIQADLAGVFEGADFTLLAATAGIVALLLLITYRSPFLWLVPLIVVGTADQVAASGATHVLATFDVVWDESTIGILSVLVFGAGTDYSLLLISRYRDDLRRYDNRYVAMTVAVRQTLEAVIASSTTVVLGLLILLFSVVPSTRGLGLACAVGVVIAAFFALAILPCALVLFGRWIFWPLVPKVGQEPLVESRTSIWRRLGDKVAKRPAGFATAAVLIVAILSVGVTQIDQGLSQSEQFLDTPESIVAAERLGESFPAGTVEPTTVLTREDPQQVVQAARGTEGVSSASVAVRGNGLSQVDVVLEARSGTEEARTAVIDLRAELASYPDTWVGGSEAQSIDATAGAQRDRAVLMPLILVLVLGGLIFLLRSLVAPLLLVATVVGTFFGALGAAWWVYTLVFDFSAMDVGVPLLAFLFLVALGVDYNIFLVTRALQETHEFGVREGMLRALTATGGVITSAGILLAAVFAVLGVLPLVVLAQLGIVIFLGVLLDTLLVRTVLVPALSLILGERFWWPRRVVDAADSERPGAHAALT